MRVERDRHPVPAFSFAVPIAVLGGLIGLGGAEFRLPVLVGPLRYAARSAVPLNLAVSLIMVVASLLGRTGVLPALPLDALGDPVRWRAGPSIVSSSWSKSPSSLHVVSIKPPPSRPSMAPSTAAAGPAGAMPIHDGRQP